MNTPRPVSREAVAALFIERQWLDKPRGRALTAASLAGFVESTGGLQIDSINVLDRAHYLTAWSRFDAYDHAKFDALVYHDRVLLEYWSHAACFVPRSHAPNWRRAMADYRRQHTGWSGWLKKNGRLLREIEQAVRDRGPLGNADFKQPRPEGGSGWWGWKPATHALHYLFMSGRLLVRERVHFQKRFDLAERVLPGIERIEPAPWPEFLRWHIRQSFHSMGAATEADLRMYLSYPRQPVARRRAALKSMLRSGEVVPVAVEGDGQKWYALADDLGPLAAAGRRRAPARGTTLLSPFDSFLWHRERVKALFGYDYRIEVYTPGHKRVHGYYTLPLFHDGRLIGRVDAKNHRAEHRLEVRHVHFEPWVARGTEPPGARRGEFDRAAAIAGLAESVGSLARFQGAEGVTLGRVTPPVMRSEVASAVTQAGLGGHIRPATRRAAASSKRVSTAPAKGETDARAGGRKSR